MKRVTEPELMLADDQAQAYAEANFAEAHQANVGYFHDMFPDRPRKAYVLDLGCGPGDVTRRFARAHPGYIFHAIDGSEAMLNQGRTGLRKYPNLKKRIHFLEGNIPGFKPPRKSYHLIISNSFLHHLHEPEGLWMTILRFGKPGTLVFVTDLFRPESLVRAIKLVAKYAKLEPEILRRDFLKSLCAAFTPKELKMQLKMSGLKTLKVRTVDDRHVIIAGRL